MLTELWSALSDEDRAQLAGTALPVGHVGQPEEVAKAYLYLMAQSYSTGRVLVVDGGGTLV